MTKVESREVGKELHIVLVKHIQRMVHLIQVDGGRVIRKKILIRCMRGEHITHYCKTSR